MIPLEQLIERTALTARRMVKIYTTKSDTPTRFIVDAEDFEIVSQHRWNISNYGYPYTRENNSIISIGRFLLRPRKDMQVDHINFNTLDNRRSNLREVTPKFNMRHKRIRSKTGHMGVYWHKHHNCWASQMRVDGKQIVRYSKNIEDAILKRKELEAQYAEY